MNFVITRFVRPLQYAFVIYLVVAVLYTTNYLLFVLFRLGLRCLPWFISMSSKGIWITNEFHASEIAEHLSALGGREWKSRQFTLEHGLGQGHPPKVDDDLLLQRAFSDSMQPSQIIPYFHRASGDFEPGDVTITTHITNNRLQVFRRLTEHYKGPISVTVHIRNTTSHIQEMLHALNTLYASSEAMATYVDMHLIIDSYDRQFNLWRNIARFFARTDYVFMLDVDFALCTDFRAFIKHNATAMKHLEKGNAALVVPAFEFVRHTPRQDKYPADKKELVALAKSGLIDMFHAFWTPGHNSTDYPRYYTAPPHDIYRVTQYQPAYEPYIIYKKEGIPWCDERFVGYGGNKAACLYEMYLSGIAYHVLADHFIIHQNHLYQEAVRRNERKYNRKMFSEFKAELCLRYMELFLAGSKAVGSNHVMQQCHGKQSELWRLSSQALKTKSKL